MAAPGHHATLHGPGLPPFTGDTRIRCHLGNADAFFSPEEERGRLRVAREQRAKTICRTCPLVARCRKWSIDAGVEYGTWGGMTEKERQQVTRWAA